MRVGILGPLEVVAEGRDVVVGGARLRALLVKLALDVGRTVPAGALAEAVWAVDGPKNPVNALQTLVARLRRALPGGRLLSVPGGYRLDLPSDAVDAYRFERLAGQGHRALREGDPEAALRLLREGLGLWRGVIGAEVPEAVRRGFEEVRITAQEDRAEAALSVGEADGLVTELEGLVAAHPFRERLRGLLIRALHSEGRQAEALTAYEEFREFLAAELGADPGPGVRKIHLAVLRGEAAAEPVRPRVRGNVRAAVTSFVGRADELDLLRTRLTHHRLITLVGPGGVGKTRLATAVAAEAPAGAWLVDLAPVGFGAVVQAVATALGVRGAGLLETPRDPVEGLVGALVDGPSLLVLDNCEHVLAEVGGFAVELLGRCPGLRVLATSREPLGIPEEVLCPVPPLGAEPAGRLFADRAFSVSPGFAVTAGNASVVADVCRRLDGLPLAIELAAARLRSLPLTDLAARLHDRLTLSARGADPRHRTLRAVVAWSWNLLDDGERRAARRLAAFPGIITVDSAEAVAAAGIEALASLTDKSLLQFDGEHYRMLETIRAYALEELTHSGERVRVRGAHAAFFTGLAERAQPYLRSSDQLPWIARLTAERDNLTGALRFARETGDAGTALRLCAALGPLRLIRGDHRTLASQAVSALEIPGEAPPEARAAVVALHLLVTGLGSGRRSDAVLAERTRRLRLDGNDPGIAFVEPVLAFGAGDADAAAAAIDRRLSHPDPWTRAMARLLRALLHANACGVAATRDDLELAVTGFRGVGERAGLAWALTSLADLLTVRGEFGGAVSRLEEAVRLLREIDPADSVVPQRVWLAEARARGGSPGEADRARADLMDLLQRGALTGEHRTFARITLGDLARRAGDLAEAARQLRRADEELHPDTGPAHRVVLHCAQGGLAMDQGDLDTARHHLVRAFDLAVAVPDPSLAAVTAAHLAWLRSLRGQAATAAELLGAAHSLVGGPDALDSDLARLGPALREELGEGAYGTAYGRGRSLGSERVLALIGSMLA